MSDFNSNGNQEKTKNTSNVSNEFRDFIQFKTMFFEILIPITYIAGMGGILLLTWDLVRHDFIIGGLIMLGLSMAWRLILEVFMVGFSILGVLREIRDRLPLPPEKTQGN